MVNGADVTYGKVIAICSVLQYWHFQFKKLIASKWKCKKYIEQEGLKMGFDSS